MSLSKGIWTQFSSFLKIVIFALCQLMRMSSDWSGIMQRYRLLPYDALIVSTCISNGIKEIATFDKDFKRVDLLEVLDLNE